MLFGRYRLVAPAGRGGTAEVWHAVDDRTGEDVAVKRELIDNITLNMVMRKHARAEAKAGHTDHAVGVMDRMISVFENKDLNPQVLQRIRQQAEATKSSIREADGGSPQDEG